MLPKGTVLFTSRAGIGNTAILGNSACTNQGFQSIIPNTKLLDTYFIFSRTKELKDYGERVGAGSTFVEVSGKQMAEMELLIPKLEEQKAIGCIFKSIDNLITLHQKQYIIKIKILSNINTTWEQRKVKDVCSISTGKSNTQDKIDDGKYPFYVRSEIIEYSNRYLYDEEAVLTVGDGVGTGKVFHYVNGKYDLHQRVYRCFGFSKDVSAKYFYYYFSKNFYDRVMQMTAKTSVDSVRYEMISDMDFIYPSLDEQNKIVSKLTNIDNLITLHQRFYYLFKAVNDLIIKSISVFSSSCIICKYVFCVVVILECPNLCATLAIDTPANNNIDACVCLNP